MATVGQRGDVKRVQTGICGLDEVLNGGLLPNRLYLVEGNPGSGKTTLALHYLLEGVKAQEPCLYITLSESREELVAGAASHGWSLDGIEIVELVPEAGDLDSDTNVTMYHPSEVELSETTQRVLEAVERVSPTRVVFDSLSEIRLLAQSSLRYRRQILALKEFFAGRKCTVLLLDDNTAEACDLQLESIAHGVISLERRAPLYGAARRRLQVSKFRGSAYCDGYHDFRIVEGGIRVYPRLVAASHAAEFPVEQIKSGVGTLDTLVGGGLDRGTSTLLVGPAGAGKSTVALQYAVAAAERGHRAVVYAFDESVRTLLARARGLGIKAEEAVRSGTLQVRQVDPAELSPGEFACVVQAAVEKEGARIIVIDSLNGYLSAMPDERLLIMQMHELLSYLGRRGVSTLLVVAQHGVFGELLTAGIETSYLADAVLLFRFFEHGGNVRKAISMFKKRSGPHEVTIRELRFGSAGIDLSGPLSEFSGVLTGVPRLASDRD